MYLIIALTGQSEETFCAVLNPSYLFPFEAVDSKDIESVRTVQSRKKKPKGDMIGVQLCQSIEVKGINFSLCFIDKTWSNRNKSWQSRFRLDTRKTLDTNKTQK